MQVDKTILVVDDDDHVRQLIRQVLEPLEDMGARLLEARDGEEAVRVARAELPDLLVLDVMMPGMSGYEVCEILRNDEALRSVKVLMLTALAGMQDRKYGYVVGVDRYMRKPIDPDDLFDETVRLLDIER